MARLGAARRDRFSPTSIICDGEKKRVPYDKFELSDSGMIFAKRAICKTVMVLKGRRVRYGYGGSVVLVDRCRRKEFIVNTEDWLAIALWGIGWPGGSQTPKINVQAVAERFALTEQAIRNWYKNGIRGLSAETVMLIEELSDVDFRLLYARGTKRDVDLLMGRDTKPRPALKSSRDNGANGRSDA